MTHRVVAGFSQQRFRCPRAPGLTDVGVVAGTAIAPQRVDAAAAVEAHRRRAFPDVDEPRIANVAAVPARGRERRTSFDRAIRFDADAPDAGAAADVMT